MKHPPLLRRRTPSRVLLTAAAGLAITGLAAASVPACLTRPIEPVEPVTSSVLVQQLAQNGVNKIDLVLAVDNSSSMADKQQILALAVPDLIRSLVNPPCISNASGQAIADAKQPSGPTKPCPTGSTREFPPVLDIHIGVLSSTLGGFGVQDISGCSTPSAPGCSFDDEGHLITRSGACSAAGTVSTYQGSGYLAWDPAQVLSPPGIAEVGDAGTAGPGSGSGIVGALYDLVVGDGQAGCGWESQDESWYRLLVDPTPYKNIQFSSSAVVSTSEIDEALLKQRQAFLRPDSLLAIIVVSDETDTSVKEYAYNPLIVSGQLSNPRSGCANGPTDKCCTSCELPAPTGCIDPDPQCAKGALAPMPYDPGLRAFGLISHKQRFGIEFFYPPSRYVDALKNPTVADSAGNQVPNPIYSNLDPAKYTGSVRDSSLVFYGAIVGVPWQLIARQKNGVPDLINGVSDIDPTQKGGFKTAAELAKLDEHGNSYWDDIAGDPENYVAARSPFMVESTTPRTGVDPITGVSMASITTPNGAGPMVGGALLNDHERSIADPPADIEYACVFPIVKPIDCTQQVCECTGSDEDPLCEANPNDNGKFTLQTKAKAYPGIKELAIARGLGNQGIAASICAKQLTDNTQPDYAYRPAMKAITDKLKLALARECLPRQLTPDADGEVACLILEGTPAEPGHACSCDGSPARSAVAPNHQAAVQAALADPAISASTCFCEIDQVSNTSPSPGALTACKTATTPDVSGWCYVDGNEGTAEAAIVSKCPPSAQRQIRFVGAGAPQLGSTVFITCSGD